MHTLRLMVVTILALLLAPLSALALEIPDFTPNVVDTSGALDASTKQSVNDELQRIRETSQIWGAVLIVGSLDGEPIENVAVQAFEKWQLGQKGIDNGLLLVLAIQDRESRFEVGYGLEGAVPDVVALHALDAHLAPKMREGDTAGAIVDAFAFLSRVVGQDPAAVRELSEAKTEPEPDWTHGLIAWGVFMIGVWLGGPISRVWGAGRRERLRALEPALLVDDEAVAGDGKSGKSRFVKFFLQCFFSLNPGCFVLVLSAIYPVAFVISIAAVLLIMYLVISRSLRKYASPKSYRQFLQDLARQREELIRKGHLKQSTSGAYEYTPAYHASRASSSRSSSSSSSSSGGGSSGGGGASSRW